MKSNCERNVRTDGRFARVMGLVVYCWGSEAILLVALLAAAGGIWIVAELADEVIEGETHVFDRRVLLAMRNPADHTDPLGPPWLEEYGRDITALGGFAVLTLVTVAAVGFLLIRTSYRTALWVLVAVVGGVLLSLILKHGFARSRPDEILHQAAVYTSSFPSGHSMMSAVTYLTIGAILARVQPNRRLKLYIIGLAILVTLLVGVSRVYLGVHWPSDVLAGWAAGATWSLLCWVTSYWLQHREKIDQSA